MKPLGRSIARKIIETVSHGIPPNLGLEYFTVGLDQYLNTIGSEYLSSFIKHGGSSFKVVVAGYGQGKTHFLYCVRNMAWKYGFVTVYVPLSPGETPFHRLDLVYRAILNRLSPPPSSNWHISQEVGIDKLIKRWVAEIKYNFENGGFDDEEVRGKLLNYVKSIPSFENINFTRALRRAFISLMEDKNVDFENVIQWLKGEGYDRKVHSAYGISERINKNLAFPLIRSLVEWIRWIGYSGLLILFDETEPLPSFTTKQKELLLSNLRELIDECASPLLKGAFIFYSLPNEDFLTSRGPIYEALRQRLDSVFDFINPTGVKIYLEQLRMEPIKFLTEIGLRLSKIYEVAYDFKFNKKLVIESAKNIAKVSYERRIIGVHRRLFVQRFIQALHIMRRNPSFYFDQEAAEKLVLGGN